MQFKACPHWFNFSDAEETAWSRCWCGVQQLGSNSNILGPQRHPEGSTHPLMEVDSVAHEGRVVDEVEARRVVRHVALEQQLLSQLDAHVWLKHVGVPQAADHDDCVMVELAERLTADVKGLLKSKSRVSHLMSVAPINLHAIYQVNFITVFSALKGALKSL